MSLVCKIKVIIKHCICPFRCLRFRIKRRDGFMYIGKACKIVNPKNMYFEKNVSIMPYTMLVGHGDEYNLTIHEGVEIGMFSRIACKNRISIGKNLITGPNLFLADYNHEYRNPEIPIKFQGEFIKNSNFFPLGGVIIEDDCWIGANVVIVGSLTIGKHCVIGANSVVNASIPDYCVAVGSPCKVVKKFNHATNKWEGIV